MVSSFSFLLILTDQLGYQTPFLHTIQDTTRMRSAPQSRLLVAISLMKLITSGESLGFLERAWDVCFGEQAKELTMEAAAVSPAG
jgi:hypothetical protein